MHEIPNLDAQGLRHFALTTGGLIAGAFGVALPLLFGVAGQDHGGVAFVAAAPLILGGLLAPATLRPVYRGWMRFGLLMNRVTTPLILGLLFTLVFIPMGLIMRLTGHDPLRRRRSAEASTYRVPSHAATRESMTRPF